MVAHGLLTPASVPAPKQAHHLLLTDLICYGCSLLRVPAWQRGFCDTAPQLFRAKRVRSQD